MKASVRTPHKSVRSKDYTSEIAPLGETIFFRDHSEDGNKPNLRWKSGVVVGQLHMAVEFVMLGVPFSAKTGTTQTKRGEKSFSNGLFVNHGIRAVRHGFQQHTEQLTRHHIMEHKANDCTMKFLVEHLDAWELVLTLRIVVSKTKSKQAGDPVQPAKKWGTNR